MMLLTAAIIAGTLATTTPQTYETPEPTHETVAKVIEGEYGNGAERIAALGENYDAIMSMVNEYYSTIATPEPESESEPEPTTTIETAQPAQEQPETNAPDLTGIPACALEDGSTLDGYEHLCYWDGSTMGNGIGDSYILMDGNVLTTW